MDIEGAENETRREVTAIETIVDFIRFTNQNIETTKNPHLTTCFQCI